MARSSPKRKTASVFWTGRSQAVRLPKEFRFETDTVLVIERVTPSFDLANGPLDTSIVRGRAGFERRRRRD
jgi:hypothetical protein